MIEIDAWHILGVEPDDLTGADRDLLWLVAGMLDYRHPFPVDSLAGEGNERQDSVTGDRHAFVRERRDGDECEIEFGVAIENFVRTQIEADRLLQHAVEVVLIAEFSFGYEHDFDGVLQEPVRFNLRPHEIFYSNAELDFTFVAVTPLSDESVPIARYGILPLIPLSGKAVDGEWVTIIQHPGNEPKQIAIRASQIIGLDPKYVPGVDLDHFIHYSTDTEPGSSGSPVLNDQWQVLALHHKAVPAPEDPGGQSKEPTWIANEGVRISAMFKHLKSERFTEPQAGLVLDRLDLSLGFPALGNSAAPGESLLEADRRPLDPARWAHVTGYDASFLSEPIALPKIYAPAREKNLVAPLLDGSGHELAYHHFTSVIRADRKFPLFTAV